MWWVPSPCRLLEEPLRRANSTTRRTNLSSTSAELIRRDRRPPRAWTGTTCSTERATATALMVYNDERGTTSPTTAVIVESMRAGRLAGGLAAPCGERLDAARPRHYCRTRHHPACVQAGRPPRGQDRDRSTGRAQRRCQRCRPGPRAELVLLSTPTRMILESMPGNAIIAEVITYRGNGGSVRSEQADDPRKGRSWTRTIPRVRERARRLRLYDEERQGAGLQLVVLIHEDPAQRRQPGA